MACSSVRPATLSIKVNETTIVSIISSKFKVSLRIILHYLKKKNIVYYGHSPYSSTSYVNVSRLASGMYLLSLEWKF